jgi:uncharacterized protein (TIGR02246 family)
MMRGLKSLLSGLILLVCSISAGAQAPRVGSQPSQELAAFKGAVRKLYDIKEGAWKRGDYEAIVTQFYSADAVSVGEGDPNTMKGVDQFRKAYKQLVQDVTSVRVESVRSVVNGSAGWDWANFYATIKPEKAKDYPQTPARILFLFSKENGKWICKGDIFVSGKFSNPL